MTVTSTYTRNVIKSEFQANSFETGNQLLPDVTGLSNGGFAVAYNNGNINDGEVVVDFYDAAHEPVGAFHIPYENGTMAVGQPQVIELSNGNVLVTWVDAESPIAYTKGHLFQADGTPIGSEIAIDPVGSDIQVTALAGGGFVVTDTRADNVWQTVFDDAGDEVSASAMVNDILLPGTQNDSAVAALSTGGYVVTYTDTNPADQVLHARIYNANGTTKVNDFALDSIGDNTEAKVVGLKDGNWAVVYTDNGWGGADAGNSAITLKVFNGNGNGLTGYIRVNTPSSQAEVEPDVTMLENGFIAVTWTKQISFTDFNVQGRVYTPAGVAVTDEFTLSLGSSDDSNSSVAGLLNGKFGAVWFDNTPDSNGTSLSAAINEIVRTTVGDAADDNFTGDELKDIVTGNGGEDILHGEGGDDHLVGGAQNDSMYGGDGNDTLEGGTGYDDLYGGAGNDLYIVDDLADSIGEDFGNGTKDKVLTSSNFVLTFGTDIEFLAAIDQAATTAINLTGNKLSQEITGNNGDNLLHDGGGIEADTLKGLGGDDTYRVYHSGDIVIEGAAEGLADKVVSAVDFTLGKGAYVEIMTTNGSAGLSNIDLTGNVFAQDIYGNAGSNVLHDGGTGAADMLKGLEGNDTYRIYNSGDIVVEIQAQGAADKVMAAVDYTLGKGVYVEQLFTNGSAGVSAIDLTGNEIGQEVRGNAGANRIDGKGGLDTLNGGSGADTFVFSSALGAGNVDTLGDFSAAADTIELENAIFGKLAATGALAAGNFRANASGVAVDANDYIVYETDTGKLFYDADGNGAGAAIQFALITGNPAITAADFVVA
ncbi:calcium-binding protein [Mesorhizobium sp. IMUNJ 23232]|uniref:calcium-binding protein n=1 Tax=Mesorhizobium sp. IMUNJ 23232 TaxID=3376064 RepID=UPI0037A9B942